MIKNIIVPAKYNEQQIRKRFKKEYPKTIIIKMMARSPHFGRKMVAVKCVRKIRVVRRKKYDPFAILR